MSRYIPGAVPTTGDVAQLERFLRAELDEIKRSTDDIYTLSNFSVDNFALAAYAGIGQNAASAPLSDITSTWATVNTFDIPLVVPRGASYDFANDALVLEVPGIWYLSIKLSLEHNELNAGRTMALRLNNFTTGAPSAVEFRYGTGRNTAVTNITLGAFFEVEKIGDALQLQLGTDGDTYSSVNCIGAIYQAHSVSEYKGDFQIEAAKPRKL